MANTTNLNLVKPAGTDKALVSVINANSDKIDAFAGTTNQALANVNGKIGNSNIAQEDVSDLNSAVILNGIKFFTYANSASNRPASGGGAGITIANGAYGIQIVYTNRGSDGDITYVRNFWGLGQSFGTWRELAVKSDVEPQTITTVFHSDLTIASNTVVKIGRVVYVQIRFSTNTQLGANVQLATGFPVVLSNVSADRFAVSLTDSHNTGFVIRKDGILIAENTINPNVNYTVTGSYVAQS